MSLTELLFRSWWLASLAVGIATSSSQRFSNSPRGSPATRRRPRHIAFGAAWDYWVAVLAVGLANTWIAFALCVKLHDRDHTGWWLVWQSLVLMLAVILIVVAIAVPSEQAPLWYALAGGASVAAFAISVWLFVEIGFLRGTQGPNRFGPDPLGAARADAQL